MKQFAYCLKTKAFRRMGARGGLECSQANQLLAPDGQADMLRQALGDDVDDLDASMGAPALSQRVMHMSTGRGGENQHQAKRAR